MIIFPEGTRSRDGKLLPFKKGAFVAAIHLGVPIVPVVCKGTTRIMPKGEYLSILPGKVELVVLEPIATAGLTYDDRDRLRDTVRAQIAAELASHRAVAASSARPLARPFSMAAHRRLRSRGGGLKPAATRDYGGWPSDGGSLSAAASAAPAPSGQNGANWNHWCGNSRMTASNSRDHARASPARASAASRASRGRPTRLPRRIA